MTLVPPVRTVLCIAALLALFSAAWLWVGGNRPSIAVEHGPMENFQAACLAIGFLFLVALFTRTPFRPLRVLYGSIGLLYATFLLLEFDTREFNWPIANMFLNGPVRNTWLGLLWFIVFALFVANARPVIACFLQWLVARSALLLFCAGLFWIGGAVIDKLAPFNLRSRNLLAEELLETNAAALMLASAIEEFYSSRPRAK
jgi:hypothetical protein